MYSRSVPETSIFRVPLVRRSVAPQPALFVAPVAPPDPDAAPPLPPFAEVRPPELAPPFEAPPFELVLPPLDADLPPVLLPLPCTITCCDPREEWLAQLPRARNLRVVRSDSPEEILATLRDDSFVLLMTKGHQTDRPILQRALAEKNFPFIGVIGSAAKAAVLRREMIAAGLAPERAEKFHCPVGLEFGTNHPHEIALSIAAQLAELGLVFKPCSCGCHLRSLG